MWFKHSISVAHQLIPIYSTTVHKNKDLYALNVVNCLCHNLTTPTSQRQEKPRRNIITDENISVTRPSKPKLLNKFQAITQNITYTCVKRRTFIQYNCIFTNTYNISLYTQHCSRARHLTLTFESFNFNFIFVILSLYF